MLEKYFQNVNSYNFIKFIILSTLSLNANICFNLFTDGVMKEFKANILNGRVKFGMGENAGKVSGLLFADDTTLMAESENNIQRYVSAFVRMCERRKLKINVGKSKVMKMSDTGEKGNLSIKVKEEVMEEVDTFRYLGWILLQMGEWMQN